jgi:hypothetical protein
MQLDAHSTCLPTQYGSEVWKRYGGRIGEAVGCPAWITRRGGMGTPAPGVAVRSGAKSLDGVTGRAAGTLRPTRSLTLIAWLQ